MNATGDRNEEINQNLLCGGGVSGKEEIDQIQAKGPAAWWGRLLLGERRGEMLLSSRFGKVH